MSRGPRTARPRACPRSHARSHARPYSHALMLIAHSCSHTLTCTLMLTHRCWAASTWAQSVPYTLPAKDEQRQQPLRIRAKQAEGSYGVSCGAQGADSTRPSQAPHPGAAVPCPLSPSIPGQCLSPVASPRFWGPRGCLHLQACVPPAGQGHPQGSTGPSHQAARPHPGLHLPQEPRRTRRRLKRVAGGGGQARPTAGECGHLCGSNQPGRRRCIRLSGVSRPCVPEGLRTPMCPRHSKGPAPGGRKPPQVLVCPGVFRSKARSWTRGAGTQQLPTASSPCVRPAGGSLWVACGAPSPCGEPERSGPRPGASWTPSQPHSTESGTWPQAEGATHPVWGPRGGEPSPLQGRQGSRQASGAEAVWGQGCRARCRLPVNEHRGGRTSVTSFQTRLQTLISSWEGSSDHRCPPGAAPGGPQAGTPHPEAPRESRPRKQGCREPGQASVSLRGSLGLAAGVRYTGSCACTPRAVVQAAGAREAADGGWRPRWRRP